MKPSFLQYFKDSLKNFLEVVVNLFIFLPYFFSVSTLLKTLFFPWKNLIVVKKTEGFAFNELFNRLAFNLISRVIGLFMRLSVITFYFLLQTFFMFSLPFLALIFLLLSPIFYLLSSICKTPDERKQLLKEKFISTHLLKEENKEKVETWFEIYYQNCLKKNSWWKLPNLFSFPPLARDWAVGYTPILNQYSTDLATSSYLHHLKNIVNREKEISEIETILSKNAEANVVVVGEEGVGKHTIIDALAKKIYLGKTNQQLIYKRILKLNLERILMEFIDQKQRENFFEELLKEASDAKNTILFIDDLEKYLSNEIGKIDLTTSINKYGKTNQLQIIGITTPFFYEKYIRTNEKINRLFSKVDVYEVSKTDALKIILSAVFDFEKYHQVTIPYETVEELIEKSGFYLTYIPFPEKAVDLLDQACVLTKLTKTNQNIVYPQFIDKVLEEKTHIPVSLTSQMKEKLLNLETLLMSQIIQQDEAIKDLSSALRRSFLLLGKRKKPLASFLFLGPTGVGKTQTAKAVAQTFFSTKDTSSSQFSQKINWREDVSESSHLIRFDMSNYQSKFDIPKLIGDITTNNPGLLSRAIREHPYGVLLLDEIEKADHDLLNIFLTILDEGYFTDGFGRRVDCKNLIIIATSNAASEAIYKNPNLPNIPNYLIEHEIFSPEFLNRFDGVIVYQPLTQPSLFLIAKKMIETISKDIYALYKVYIKVSEASINQLIEKAYDPRFGARNLERTIRTQIEDTLAKIILEKPVKEGEIISL